jgi:hypothetical protein
MARLTEFHCQQHGTGSLLGLIGRSVCSDLDEKAAERSTSTAPAALFFLESVIGYANKAVSAEM